MQAEQFMDLAIRRIRAANRFSEKGMEESEKRTCDNVVRTSCLHVMVM
jgi:hypothetical protein